MSFFNGVVGVHIAIIMRRVPKGAKKERDSDGLSSTYLPLVDQDEGYSVDKASQKGGTSGVGKFAGSLHEDINKEAKAEQPPTAHVWAWVLLCGCYRFLTC